MGHSGDGDQTSADTEPAPEPGASAPELASYRVGELIGRGGMGEVLLAHDLRIGRDVAVKRLRTAEPSAHELARFLREATIQARLEHPSIVPVHELGTDASGRPYFTMKRLAGVTLQHKLRDPEASLQELLRAFIDVCFAIEFAHSRGVIHRDLKPANIMVGDFGEVYVLDWGVARVVAAADDTPSLAHSDTPPGETELGTLLGTPGYMAPEQAVGDPATSAADVYALGSILFEILAREPLHPPGPPGLVSTLDRPTASPVARAPDRGIAPELDAACVAALARAPAARPSARQLARLVQRFLDGDRDLERRRTLAEHQLAIADAALASGDPTRRAEAMRAAGRALALDPSSTRAAAVVSSLMLEPPTTLPTTLVTELAEAERRLAMVDGRGAMLSHLVFMCSLPLILWDGVTDAVPVAGAYAVSLSLAWGWYRFIHGARWSMWWTVPLNALLLALVTRVAGPLVVTPVLLATTIGGLATQRHLLDRPLYVIGGLTLALAVPLALEAFGVLSETWRITGGELISRSAAIAIDGLPTYVVLLVATLGTPIVGGLYNRSIAVARRDAHRKLEIQAWHLRQLVEPA